MECSGQHGNSKEIKEMLKEMRQERQEIDEQLKLQLQLRNEYMSWAKKERSIL